MRESWLSRVALGYPQTLLMPTAAVGGLIWLWAQTPTSQWAEVPAPWASGLVVWSLLEYLLHRYVLHHVQPFNAWHLHHHRHPEVPMQTPVLFSLALVLTLAALPAIVAADRVWALAFSAGLIAGHWLQECVHFHLHQRRPPCASWLKSRWCSHHIHHEGGELANFGTLTGFWDGIFHTRAQTPIHPSN